MNNKSSNITLSFSEFLNKIDVSENHNIILHSSYRFIKNNFNIKIEEVIKSIQEIITENGSLIIPTFTYNWKFENIDSPKFDRINSQSQTGAVSEVFRKMEDVTRTSSPTHSFGLWGKVNNNFDETNSPESPLGKNSVLEWLANNKNSFVFLLGVDFSSLTFLHYLEIYYKIPWYNFSPWEYLSVLPVGVSVKGEVNIIEMPGCSKSFINYEKYLLDKRLIINFGNENNKIYYIPVNLLITEGEFYFNNFYHELLCPANNCKACDSRRNKFL